jgi:glycosyltransferase involved in cell wall biosynthesis
MAGEVVIGFIGTFGKWHGAEMLARAFARLAAERPDLRGRIRLLMIGDGLTRPEAERALREAGAADRAVFTGLVPQDQGAAHLAACDILASPHVVNPDGSRFFGSPTKLFEYMAMGRPIVASKLDQIGDVLREDETALLVPPGDAAALARALATLVADADTRRRLGDAARRDAVAKHSWTAHVRRILMALGQPA